MIRSRVCSNNIHPADPKAKRLLAMTSPNCTLTGMVTRKRIDPIWIGLGQDGFALRTEGGDV